jgi:hypothetical protein
MRENMRENLGEPTNPTANREVKCSTDPAFSPELNPRPERAVLMEAISVGEKSMGGDACSTKSTSMQSSWLSSRPLFRGPSDLSGSFKSRTLLPTG